MPDGFMSPDGVAEWIAMQKAKNVKPPGPLEEPPLSSLDKEVIGKAVRIELPFAVSPHKFRKFAELLRGFADDLDFLSRELPLVSDKDYAKKRRSLCFELKQRAWVIRRRVREIGE